MCEALSVAAKELPTTNTRCTFPTQCSLPQVCGGDHHSRVCEEGGCLSYCEQEAERRNTQGEIQPCRPSSVAQFSHHSPTPGDEPGMHLDCVISICLCACFFVSLLFYQHKCEGKRGEQKVRSRAKVSCAVRCLSWDVLVKL